MQKKTSSKQDKLKSRQREFIVQYLLNGRNAVQAAIAAGYNADGAASAASRLLGSKKIREAMNEALKNQNISFDGSLEDFVQLYFDGMAMAKVYKNAGAYNQSVRGLAKIYGMEVNKHEINDLSLSKLLDNEAEMDAENEKKKKLFE